MDVTKECMLDLFFVLVTLLMLWIFFVMAVVYTDYFTKLLNNLLSTMYSQIYIIICIFVLNYYWSKRLFGIEEYLNDFNLGFCDYGYCILNQNEYQSWFFVFDFWHFEADFGWFCVLKWLQKRQKNSIFSGFEMTILSDFDCSRWW